MKLLEEERKSQARRSLTKYAAYVDVPGAPAPDYKKSQKFYAEKLGAALHHRKIAAVCEAIDSGKIKNAMVFAPPGTAKSTWISVVFSTWFLGKNPRKDIISTSYGDGLSLRFSRKCRQLARSPEYAELFKTDLVSDNKALDFWSLQNGSSYMCGGILSGLTGNRADGIVVDDPVKGREQADSPTIQKKTFEAYTDDLKTRLKPGGWTLIIQTRWNENDLAGQILPDNYAGESGWIKCKDGKWWYVLCLQAECERADDPLGRQPGERIWPEYFPPDHFDSAKLVHRTWSALYQQRPSPDQGLFFKREWFRFYEPHQLPVDLYKYGASDYATKEAEGDYTCHGVGGVDWKEDLFILDWFRKQIESDKAADKFLDLVKLHATLEWGQEKGQIANVMGPFIRKRMNERKIYQATIEFPTTGTKVEKARAFQARMSQGKVWFPASAPWMPDLMSEMLSFNAGKNDDQVDVLGLLGRMMDSMVGKFPKKPETARLPSGDYKPAAKYSSKESMETWRT